MTPEMEPAQWWLGLCRKPPVVCPSLAGIGILPVSAFGEMAGSSRSPGAVHRGIGSAIAGMRILNRNRQLLWFTLLAGFVLAGNAAGQGALYYLTRFLQPAHFPAGGGPVSLLGMSLYDIVSYSLDFILAFATLFCLVFILAGLTVSIPSGKKDAAASFSEGIRMAKQFLVPIILWSLALAAAGFLLERTYVFLISTFPHELGFLYMLGNGYFVSVIGQFPFNWTLDWNMLTEIPGYGGRSLLLLIYPFGFLETLHFSAISLLLFILTPFMVPRIILGRTSLREAVAGSVALMKMTWAEAGTCVLFLGIIVSAIFLGHLLVQAASGIVSPYETIAFHPSGIWVALALVYNMTLAAFALGAATVAGIGLQEIYTGATGQPGTGSQEPRPD